MKKIVKKVSTEPETDIAPTMSTKEFIIRFIAFVVSGCVLPFAFIAYRYDIFKSPHSTLTGVGFLAIILVLVFAIYILNMIKKAHPHTMMTQIISGYTYIAIFLLLPLLWVQAIEGDIEMYEQVLEVVILCEMVAIPVNPLPLWAYQKNIEFTGLSLKSLSKTMGKFFK